MSRRSMAIDIGLAALVLGLELAVLAAGGLGTRAPNAASLDVWGVLLACASSVPLIFRRHAPSTVYAVVALATVALVGLHYPLDFPFGPVVAAYTLAAGYGTRWGRWQRVAAGIAAAAFVPVTAVAYALNGYWAGGVASGIAFWALAIIGAWLAGDHSRLRRDRIVELEERAVRAGYEAERDRLLATAEERIRIARELHDSAGHAINVILVQAGAARLLRERDREGSRRALATVEDVARGTIVEIDRLVRVLRDGDGAEALPPADPAALDALLASHRASGLAISADIRGRHDGIPRTVAWAAYRILQEALTNAARHGRGSAEVAVWYAADSIDITVTNPTDGVTPGRVGGHGIVGMRERASLLGGSFHACAEDSTFRLCVRLPSGERTDSWAGS